MSYKRVFTIVLDSFGVGELPDASDYGDEGSNTLKSISKSELFHVPYLKKLGLCNIDKIEVGEKEISPIGQYGKMNELSKGKDSTTGHWELAGIISEKPFPTYPDGFPTEIIKVFEEKTGRKVLCNKVYSGTAVLDDYGKEHLDTGGLIVYTSADSVFQIAAHEEIVPLEELYNCCEIARDILKGEHAAGRVIARPFIGKVGNFTRTTNRHDYSLLPPKDTMLDYLKNKGYDVISVGKIFDLFAGVGITEKFISKTNQEGMEKLSQIQEKDFIGLCMANLVDFDTNFGHRNNVDGYANAISEFDKWLGERFIPNMREEDVLIITADHGCDPETPSTDHSREYVPILIYSQNIQSKNLGIINGFSYVSDYIKEIF